mmetsp:Transcript_8323/g.20339  ORF Transcript_8323/g.20339 Transcript_8323/m.20339 type:complete len:201 (+) Transcript_8323:122-724(+)
MPTGTLRRSCCGASTGCSASSHTTWRPFTSSTHTLIEPVRCANRMTTRGKKEEMSTASRNKTDAARTATTWPSPLAPRRPPMGPPPCSSPALLPPPPPPSRPSGPADGRGASTRPPMPSGRARSSSSNATRIASHSSRPSPSPITCSSLATLQQCGPDDLHATRTLRRTKGGLVRRPGRLIMRIRTSTVDGPTPSSATMT